MSATISVSTGTPFLVNQLPPCFVSAPISLSQAVISFACCSTDPFSTFIMPYGVVLTPN